MRTTGWIAGFFVFAAIMICRSAAARADAHGMWRSPVWGASNVLYSYLKSCRHEVGYREIVNTQIKHGGERRYSAQTIEMMSNQLGYPLSTASITAKELLRHSLPVIAYLDGTRPGDGAFILVFSIQKDKIYYLNGPTSSIVGVERESFFRTWSGFILQEGSPRLKQYLTCGASFAFGVLIQSLLYRRAK